MTNKVYVVQENNYVDYSDAERFGELVFLTNSELKPVSGSLINEQITDLIDKKLERFTESDYLVLTGNPAAIGYAFHRAALAAPTVNVLLWDKMYGRYKSLAMEV